MPDANSLLIEKVRHRPRELPNSESLPPLHHAHRNWESALPGPPDLPSYDEPLLACHAHNLGKGSTRCP